MTTLITGGSKCGKSVLGEGLLGNFEGKKLYIATMQPFGEEAREAILRHRKMRAGKGFETVDIYTDIEALDIPAGSAFLLECMGNLLANEMFREGEIFYPADKIVEGVLRLAKQAGEGVIITNQVGGDGILGLGYDEGTELYIKALCEINARLAAFADNVIECVWSIPIVLKGALK